MKHGVLTKLRLIAFLSSILFFWDDKTTLAGSVMHSKEKVILGETHDNSQVPKFLVLDTPSGRKSLIEIEGETKRKESNQNQPGRYTKGCRDVTVGECSIPPWDLIDNFTYPSLTVQKCQYECFSTQDCEFFRFDGHNCLLMDDANYRDCNVKAGPPDTMVYDCIGNIGMANGLECNGFLQEDCEYLGATLDDSTGSYDNNILCQMSCEESPACKYWIYHEDTQRCILKKDSNRNCKSWGGKFKPEFDYCIDELKIKLKDI